MDTSDEFKDLVALARDIDNECTRRDCTRETGDSEWVTRAVHTIIGTEKMLDLDTLRKNTYADFEAQEKVPQWVKGDMDGENSTEIFTQFFPPKDSTAYGTKPLVLPAVSRSFGLRLETAPEEEQQTYWVRSLQEAFCSKKELKVIGLIEFCLDSKGLFQSFHVGTAGNESLKIELDQILDLSAVYTNSKGEVTDKFKEFPEAIRPQVQTFLNWETEVLQVRDPASSPATS